MKRLHVHVAVNDLEASIRPPCPPRKSPLTPGGFSRNRA
jgi:hypothetical protein